MTSFAGFSMPLSLTIGLSAINNKPTCITSACDYEMTVSINNDLIITAYDYQHYLKYQ